MGINNAVCLSRAVLRLILVPLSLTSSSPQRSRYLHHSAAFDSEIQRHFVLPCPSAGELRNQCVKMCSMRGPKRLTSSIDSHRESPMTATNHDDDNYEFRQRAKCARKSEVV